MDAVHGHSMSLSRAGSKRAKNYLFVGSSLRRTQMEVRHTICRRIIHVVPAR